MITSFLNSYNPTWGDRLQEICCCQGWKLIFQSSFYMNEVGPRSRTIILHHSRNTRSQHLRCISLLKGAGNHFTTRGCHQRQHVHGTPPGLSMSTRTPPDGSHRATLVLMAYRCADPWKSQCRDSSFAFSQGPWKVHHLVPPRTWRIRGCFRIIFLAMPRAFMRVKRHLSFLWTRDDDGLARLSYLSELQKTL